MTFFPPIFLGSSIFHFFTVIPSIYKPILNSIPQPLNLLSLYSFLLPLQPWTTWKKSFLDKSFSYCRAIHQRIPDFATLQCFIFWWPGSSIAASITTYSPTQSETAAQKPSLGLLWDPSLGVILDLSLPPWPCSLLDPMAIPSAGSKNALAENEVLSKFDFWGSACSCLGLHQDWDFK